MTGSADGRLDPAVVAALYVEYADELRAFLTGVLRDRELAGEALQATFAKVVERGHTARNETLKGWLFRVAYNEALALRRVQQTRRNSNRKLACERNGTFEPPDETLVRREQIERVRAALETLSHEQQQVVRLRIYDGKKFAVIAAELGLPLGTVLTRMRLALQKLAGALETDE